jgi:hypothetical protein
MKPLHHKTVKAVLKAIDEGKTYASIRQQFGVSFSTIMKYKRLNNYSIRTRTKKALSPKSPRVLVPDFQEGNPYYGKEEKSIWSERDFILSLLVGILILSVGLLIGTYL